MRMLWLREEEFLWKKYITDNNLVKMAKVKVTQVRSVIKRPSDQKKTMIALGLKGMNKSVEHEGTPQIMGMINKVKHLVNVEEVK